MTPNPSYPSQELNGRCLWIWSVLFLDPTFRMSLTQVIALLTTLSGALSSLMAQCGLQDFTGLVLPSLPHSPASLERFVLLWSLLSLLFPQHQTNSHLHAFTFIPPTGPLLSLKAYALQFLFRSFLMREWQYLLATTKWQASPLIPSIPYILVLSWCFS